MPYLIGMDEAGYGPNLGPLVISVVALEVPGEPWTCDPWEVFDGVVSRSAAGHEQQIQIADSKQVYSPARGLATLERGVTCAVAVARHGAVECGPQQGKLPSNPPCATFRALCRRIVLCDEVELLADPWMREADLTLPRAFGAAAWEGAAARWQERCAQRGVSLAGIWSDLVPAARFNDRTRQLQSKGRALTELSMALLRTAFEKLGFDHDGLDGALVVADKHGGRNRYHEFLPVLVGERFVRSTCESRACSRYACGNVRISFEARAERHFAVALASMVSKYLRELSMELFNEFWMARLPGLAPTAGYPVDARRFRGQIAALQHRLGIPDHQLWRER